MKNIIIRPLMTEKASLLVSKNVYSFEVTEESNKYQIAETLETMYKVKVAGVRVAKKKGKTRRVGRTMKRKLLPDVKIAYVTLKEGKLDLFPQA
jgi:large subunit ribosomal protein L23